MEIILECYFILCRYDESRHNNISLSNHQIIEINGYHFSYLSTKKIYKLIHIHVEEKTFYDNSSDNKGTEKIVVWYVLTTITLQV